MIARPPPQQMPSNSRGNYKPMQTEHIDDLIGDLEQAIERSKDPNSIKPPE